jgi:hypothetical protein
MAWVDKTLVLSTHGSSPDVTYTLTCDALSAAPAAQAGPALSAPPSGVFTCGEDSTVTLTPEDGIVRAALHRIGAADVTLSFAPTAEGGLELSPGQSASVTCFQSSGRGLPTPAATPLEGIQGVLVTEGSDALTIDIVGASECNANVITAQCVRAPAASQ